LAGYILYFDDIKLKSFFILAARVLTEENFLSFLTFSKNTIFILFPKIFLPKLKKNLKEGNLIKELNEK